jgi:hypothetical protein
MGIMGYFMGSQNAIPGGWFELFLFSEASGLRMAVVEKPLLGSWDDWDGMRRIP